MARKNRRRVDEARPLAGGYAARSVESHGDGDWIVQRVAGSRATKEYRCPGCDQLIMPGTAHVVAYRDDDPRGSEDRRHWHSPCWSARERRAPGNRRR